MTTQTVSAKAGTEDTDPSASVTYDFGDNLDEAVALFGGDVVFSRFKAASIVDLQAIIRRHLTGEKPKTEAEIQALVNEWKPGVSQRVRKSPAEKAMEAFATLSDAEKTALLEQLMSADK